MPTTARPSFRKTTESFAAGAKTLPQHYFISPEIFAAEQKQIFSENWLLVGHESEVARTGDYFLAEVAGESLIVLRGNDGALRAFHNVCRHRGTRLCQERSGHVRAIQCPYHAWTYTLEGRLTGAPQMDEVPGFVKSDYPLYPVSLGRWEGFLFVNLSLSPTLLDDWFAPLAGKFAHWNLPNLRSAQRIDYMVQANWKLIFENYSECYHCPGVHPALAKLTPFDSAENDLCEGPFLGGFMAITKGRSLTMSGNTCALPVGDIGAEDHQRVFYYSIFPNMLLSMHPDYVMVHQLWPEAPDRTRILCHWFFHPEASLNDGGRHPYAPADAIEFWDMTNKQDWHVCELSQQGISSSAYAPGPYSARESIPAAWDREYLRRLEKASAEARQ